jgi:hypothetical protein
MCFRYASDFMRSLDANLNTQDYVKKTNAFFEYAWYDPEIVREPRNLKDTFLVSWSGQR